MNSWAQGEGQPGLGYISGAKAAARAPFATDMNSWAQGERLSRDSGYIFFAEDG